VLKRVKGWIISAQLKKNQQRAKPSAVDLSDVCLWSASSQLADLDQHDLFISGFIIIPPKYLFAGCDAYVSHQSVDVHFSSPFQMLSSAVFNGGYQLSQRYINLRVDAACLVGATTPKQVFQQYLSECPLMESGSTDFFTQTQSPIGMMTAAAMDSCRVASITVAADDGEEKIVVIVTSGIGNLCSAGDEAEYRRLYSRVHGDNPMASMPSEIGTINIFAVTSALLSPAAQAEALLVITEAKVLALTALQLISPISGQWATGTGTDAVAIACPALCPTFSPTLSPTLNAADNVIDDAAAQKKGQPCIDFVGKHTIFGECLGRAVYAAVVDSISPKGISR
jgi:adenosylcobinamide amidohydrolase